MSQSNVPLAELVAELRQLCQSGKTGKYVVTTLDNRFVSFGLEGGRLVAINIGTKTGTDALAPISAILGGSGTFMELGRHPGQMALPDNESIFEQLLAGPPGQNALQMSPALDPADRRNANAGRLTEHSRAVITQALANQIGPMANIVSQRALAKAGDLRIAIDIILKEIPDPTKAKAFIAEIRSKL